MAPPRLYPYCRVIRTRFTQQNTNTYRHRNVVDEMNMKKNL
jgi:hypothetical protein